MNYRIMTYGNAWKRIIDIYKYAIIITVVYEAEQKSLENSSKPDKVALNCENKKWLVHYSTA